MVKKNFAKYNAGDGIIEIIIRDHSGAKQDVFKANHQDWNAQTAIGNLLSVKYDIDLSPKNKQQKHGFFDF